MYVGEVALVVLVVYLDELFVAGDDFFAGSFSMLYWPCIRFMYCIRN